MRTLGQKRAEFALKKVLELKTDKEDFKNFINGIPTMIIANGFGQCMAFLKAKAKSTGNNKHQAVFDIVKGWLIERELITSEQVDSSFLEFLYKMDHREYRAAQEEALRILEWVKRFANADFEEAV